MADHTAAAIANEFLKLARRDGTALTHMQLQKLPYIAHGWALAILKNPLINSSPCAWKYGPVYPGLYDALSRYGAGPVDELVRANDGNVWAETRGDIVEERLSKDERRLLDMVWRRYGTRSGIELSSITHRSGTPWTETWEKHGNGSPIPDDLIRKHYDQLLSDNMARNARKVSDSSSATLA